ncbi:MAG: type II secretion system protein [Candidatus Brocadiia bacterium]
MALWEVVVVLLVVAAISGVLACYALQGGAQAAGTTCDQNVTRINQAIEKWYFDKGRWPEPDLSDLGRDPAYFPGGIPRCPVTGEPYRMDAETHRVLRHHH